VELGLVAAPEAMFVLGLAQARVTTRKRVVAE